METDRALRDQLLHLLRGGNAHMTFDDAVADFPMERINARRRMYPIRRGICSNISGSRSGTSSISCATPITRR